jgi:uncharacterized membrane protein (DUF485 family)
MSGQKSPSGSKLELPIVVLLFIYFSLLLIVASFGAWLFFLITSREIPKGLLDFIMLTAVITFVDILIIGFYSRRSKKAKREKEKRDK